MRAPKIPTYCISNAVIVCLFFLFTQHSNSQQLAFPLAKGAGAYATGGRGGQVIHVTTLNWTGPGSLKAALQTPGPRTIVFDVSGEIDATSQGYFEDIIVGSTYDNLTIAGQSAPHGGITIKTSYFLFEDVDNIIVRYIRFRDTNTYGETDPMWFKSCSNVIMDHCTYSHGQDEAMDMSYSINQSGNVTIQNCFFQDSKTGAILGVDSGGNTTPLPDLGNFTFINNLFSNISHRFPNPQGNGHYDIINNVVYNFKSRLSRITNEGTYNFVNNYYKTSNQGLRRNGWYTGNTVIPHLQKAQLQVWDTPLIYTAGNIVTGQRETPQSDDSDMWTVFAGSDTSIAPIDSPLPSQYFTSSQFPLVGNSFVIKTANQSYIDVLNDVGANKTLNADGSKNLYQDTKDAADILMIRNDTFVSNSTSDFIYKPYDQIPYPIIPQNTRPGGFYSSNAHIPETWFQAHVPSGQNHNNTSPSGYTWLEEYLNGVDRDDNTESITANAGQDVSICEGSNTILTATGGSTYQWNTGATTASITVSPTSTTTYTVTAFDATGNTSDTDDVTVTVNPIPDANAGNDVSTCLGTAVTLTATGGTSYLWDTGATTASISVNPNSTRTYSVEVIQNGCTDLDDVTVTVNPTPIINAGSDISIDLGQSTTLTATGATLYEWSTGETTATINVSPTVTTTYNVTGTSDGCLGTDSVTVMVIDTSVNANAGEDTSICDGASTTLTATGGVSYLWSNGATTASITVSPNSTTTYTVTAFDATGNNSDTDQVIVSVNPIPIVNAGNDVTITIGDTVTLTASGANNYLWNTGATTASINVSPLSVTTYMVTGTTDGCEDTDSVTVLLIDIDVNANAGGDVSICEGNSTILTATGGNTYEWSTGETTASITVNPSTTTTYTVTAYGPLGINSDEDDVIVTVNSLPSVDAGSDMTINLGETVTLSATGANSYEWSTGATTSTINVNPDSTTTYTVTGTTNGCQQEDAITVTVIDTSVNANAGDDVSICDGGSATLSASGGSTYQWSTGETTSSITVSPDMTTTYTVTAYDATGQNSDTDDVTVTVGAVPVADAGADVWTCRGTSVTLTATGGGSYLWETGATTASITVNPNNTRTYTVEVTQNGCTSTDDVTVSVNPLPSVDAGSNVTINVGESTTLTATGASSYVWSTGATTSNIEVSPTSTMTYTVTGTSGSGCERTDTVTVTVLTGDDVTANAGDDVSICDGGSATLSASGGSTYQWSTGETTSSITVSPDMTTTYTVTAYDATGQNSDTDDVTVTVGAVPVADAGADVWTCRGTSVTLTATGGGSYLWETGATTASITVNPNNTRTYTVEVTQNGCTSTDDVTVSVNPLPSVDAGSNMTINLGETVALSATGANSYEWSTGATTSTINVNPDSTTTYTVTGTTNGCQQEDAITVTVIDTSVNANAGDDVSICDGGSATLSASGGSTYQWSTGETTSSITVSPDTTTTYTLTAYDATGQNSDTDDVTVTVGAVPVADAGADVWTCRGTSVTLTATGGGSYLWETGATTASITVNPNNTRTYTVEVTQNGCSSTDDVTVTVNPLPSVDAGSNVTINLGESTTLTATGASSYVWSTGATTSSIEVSPTTTTTYNVTGTVNGCEGTDTVTVTVIEEAVVADAGENETTCRGYSVTLTASGGESYLWNTGQTTQSITVNPNSTTTYTVTAYSGSAQDTDEVTVFVNPNPAVNILNGDEVTILEGEFITLSAVGANTYEWNNGATQANIAVSPNGTTTYSVKGYINNCFDEKAVTVNVVPEVNAFAGNSQTICLNESVILTATGGEEFLWSTGETTESISVSPLETTEYSVTVYNELDYDTAEVMVSVEDCSVDEIGDEIEPFEFLVFPNPTSGNVKIKISGLLKFSNITLYDLAGKTLYHEVISTSEQLGFEKDLDLSSFSDGLYLLKLVDDGYAITKKIVLHR